MNFKPLNTETRPVYDLDCNPDCRSLDTDARYRVWLYAYENWQPISCSDLPTAAVAVEAAEPSTFSAQEAARYVRAFNMTAMRTSSESGPKSGPKIWAVALPVAVFYRGDPRPGQPLLGGGSCMRLDYS